MAFKDLDVDELQKVVEFFVIDVESAKDKPSKKELLAALASGDQPLSWDDYENVYLPTLAKPEPEEEPEPDLEPEPEEEQPVLDTVLKMERANGRYDILGYTFTKEHPYRPVTTEDADWIVTHEEGFRRATTQEVADYYS